MTINGGLIAAYGPPERLSANGGNTELGTDNSGAVLPRIRMCKENLMRLWLALLRFAYELHRHFALLIRLRIFLRNCCHLLDRLGESSFCDAAGTVCADGIDLGSAINPIMPMLSSAERPTT
jgi:hypothetical protein